MVIPCVSNKWSPICFRERHQVHQSGGQISLALREEGSDAVFSIADNGIGLEGQAVENIFELFTQVDRSPDRRQAAWGWG